MQDFKKLIVWQKAHGLTLTVYKETITFPKEEVYGLTSQLRRASSSIAANIAEGTGKYSIRDINRFFQIALGSAKEVEYFLILSKDLHYLNSNSYCIMNNLLSEVRAMLLTLIKKNNEVNENIEGYQIKNELN